MQSDLSLDLLPTVISKLEHSGEGSILVYLTYCCSELSCFVR